MKERKKRKKKQREKKPRNTGVKRSKLNEIVGPYMPQR